MSNGIIAVRYAKALIKYANESGSGDSLYQEALRLSYALRDNLQWKSLISNPTLSYKIKVGLIESLLLESSENVSDEMSKFLKLAIFAGRGEILLFMIENYIAMYRNMNNILRASLITAHLVGDDTRKKLFRLVEGVYDGTVEWNERVDEKIQGGFILKVNGYMLDASVKTSIERVKKEIVEKNKRKV